MGETFFTKMYMGETFFTKMYMGEAFFIKMYMGETFFTKVYMGETFFTNMYMDETFFTNMYMDETFFTKMYMGQTFFTKMYMGETFFTKMYMGETFFIKMYIKFVGPRKHLKIKKMLYLFTDFYFFSVINHHIRNIVTEKTASFQLPLLKGKERQFSEQNNETPIISLTSLNGMLRKGTPLHCKI